MILWTLRHPPVDRQGQEKVNPAWSQERGRKVGTNEDAKDEPTVEDATRGETKDGTQGNVGRLNISASHG